MLCLTAVPLRRLYSTVLSTAFYVFASLMVDALVLLVQCGAEWLRLTASLDVRVLATGSSAVVCKVRHTHTHSRVLFIDILSSTSHQIATVGGAASHADKLRTRFKYHHH